MPIEPDPASLAPASPTRLGSGLLRLALVVGLPLGGLLFGGLLLGGLLLGPGVLADSLADPPLAPSTGDAPPLAESAEASAPTERGLSPEVAAHVRELLAEGYHSALVIGIVDAEGERFFAFGEAEHGFEVDAADGPNGVSAGDGRPLPVLGPDSIFEIGSISKVFNGVLLVHLAETTDLALDDPVSRHLPAGVELLERGKPIRLLDLATHVSGLPRMPTNFDPADPRNPYADYDRERLFAYLAEQPPVRAPGEQYEYSNLAAGLLGVALGHRAGDDWPSLVHEVVLEPLGMTSTAVELDPALGRRFVQGFDMLGQPSPGWGFGSLAAAGALRSSARDLLRFVAANAGLVEPPMADPMADPLLATLRATHEKKVELGPEGGVAVGWHLRFHEGRTLVWHNGGTGGYRSFAGFVQGGELGVVVLTNNTHFVDALGFHLLAPSLPLPELARKKIPLFAKD